MALQKPEPEGEVVVGDAVRGPPGAYPRILGDRHDPFDQAQLLQVGQHLGNPSFTADRVDDLRVSVFADRNRAEHLLREAAHGALGGEDQLALGTQQRAWGTGEPAQVVLDVGAGVPPGQVQRHPAADTPHPGAIRRGELGQHERRLVRAERVHREPEVEPAVQRRALFGDGVHRADRRAAEQHAELGAGPDLVPHRPQGLLDGGLGRPEFGELVHDRQQGLALRGAGDGGQGVRPPGEGLVGQVATAEVEVRR